MGKVEAARTLALALANAESLLSLHSDLIQKRIDSGMSQTDVAEVLGRGVSWVRRFEDQEYSPDLTEIGAYALAVGASVEVQIRTH